MEEYRLTRPYLDTLSTEDLTLLARRLGLDLPEDLNRVFIITELLDAAAEDDDEPDGELREDEIPAASDRLPSTYNENYISVLLRDPLWAYVFWEIRQSERDARENDPRFGGYRLRVAELAGPNGPVRSDSFSVSVGASDDAWYLCLPGDAGWYRVDLICLCDGVEKTLAQSLPFTVPRGADDLGAGDDDCFPLLTLSGLNDLRVLRAGDRESRLPQRCES